MSLKITRHILLRLDEEFFIRIEKQAKKEMRSNPAFIKHLIKQYLEGVEKDA